MIKAIITDVDGVLSGSIKGYNFPLPHRDVIDALSKIHQKGIPVILCSAKFNFAILGAVKAAKLNNPHITDAGALIIDLLDNKIIKQHNLSDLVVNKIIGEFLLNKLHLEVYTPSDYYIDVNSNKDITERRQAILQKEPIVINLLKETSKFAGNTIKIETITDKIELSSKLFNQYTGEIEFVWAQNPSMSDVKIGCATKKGVSKETAAKEVAQTLQLSFDEILGIGDTKGDWNFMKLCKYVAVVGGESEELINLSKTKGEGNYFIAPNADKHGVLEIFNYFSL